MATVSSKCALHKPDVGGRSSLHFVLCTLLRRAADPPNNYTCSNGKAVQYSNNSIRASKENKLTS